MVDPWKPTDDMLQDFLDGRLKGHDRARVAAYLLSNRDAAYKLRQMRELDERLRDFGRDLAMDPIPDHLLDFLRREAVKKDGDS